MTAVYEYFKRGVHPRTIKSRRKKLEARLNDELKKAGGDSGEAASDLAVPQVFCRRLRSFNDSLEFQPVDDWLAVRWAGTHVRRDAGNAEESLVMVGLAS